MNFTKSPYEVMMKQRPRPRESAPSKAPRGSLPLLAGDRLPVLLPGFAQIPQKRREVMLWSVS